LPVVTVHPPLLFATTAVTAKVLAKTAVSSPSPPKMASLPPPPVSLLAPASPVRVSAALPPMTFWM
jgi:hypothetical protein